MGKYNQDRQHNLNNGFFVPYEHSENDNSTRKLKLDRFSSFIEVEEIEEGTDEKTKDTIDQIERNQLERLKQWRQQQEVDNEDMLVNEAKKLSTTHQTITGDILEIEFNEDSKDRALFKALIKEQDVKMHQFSGWPKESTTTPLMDLSQMLEMKKYQMLQNGIEEVPISASNPKVADMYKRLGGFLSRYKSGKLPRSFKIIPMLKNWDEIILLTDPQSWTPQAIYEASKLFISLQNAHLKDFINYVLLPYTRKRIVKNNDYHLEYPLFLALHITLLKSRAFTLGCILPVCQSNELDLMEISVIACITALYTKLRPVPIIWSLMTLPFNIPTTIFLLVALEKKKALPLTFYSPLAHYFIRADSVVKQLPFVWYQATYAFIKYYGSELNKDQLSQLMKIVRSRKGQNTEIALELQTALIKLLPSHKLEDFDSASDEEDGLKDFNEEILSDNDIESSDESDVDDDNYGADNDDDGDDDDYDDFNFDINRPIGYEKRDNMILD